MSVRTYDAIVAGAGSMGAAACYYLARQGYSVLGLEQFDTVPHELGSHAGQSRIIRKAYYEHPGYVPLLERAYANWQELETLTGEQVYYRTGLLYCGPSDHPVIKGVKDAALKYKIGLDAYVRPVEFPEFSMTAGDEMLLEPDAGFLLPEKSIGLFIREAIKNGAEIRTGEQMTGWKKVNGVIEVQTNRGTLSAKKLIITAGAWASPAIKEFKVPLKVTRQVILWVEPEHPSRFWPEHFPCWMRASNNINGVWYGFPLLRGKRFPGPEGLKFALHHAEAATDPDKVNREVSREEINGMLEDVANYFSAARGRVVDAKTCLYTNSPDEDFIIDHLPGYDGDVTIACGFSGHGFKFASAVGEILADLAMKGRTELPVGFLGIARFE